MVVFCQKLSSVKGHLPSRSSSSFGSISFLGFSHECGIAMLSLSLFVSLSWSTKMISIIFRCVSISSFRTVTHSLTHSLTHSVTQSLWDVLSKSTKYKCSCFTNRTLQISPSNPYPVNLNQKTWPSQLDPANLTQQKLHSNPKQANSIH